MDGKEFSNRLIGISKIKVEIGKAEDSALARRQEKQIIECPEIVEALADFELVGIEKWLRDNNLEHKTQKERNIEESRYGDIALIDSNGRISSFLELKVGTKPPLGNGPYYGACSITSLCNKLKGMKSDRIPRILLAIDSDGNFRICDPLKMLNWLLTDKNAFLLRTKDKEKANWTNEYTRKLSGKIRVGYSNNTASKDNIVYGADYFPSFPFVRHYFDF